MTTLTNPHTLAALRELGCLDDDRINGAAVAAVLARRLETDHVAASLEDVTAVEITVGQLATGLIGAEDPELVDAIRPLLSPSATGKVQRALANGNMLCAGRTVVTISIEGELVSRSVSTRFLSEDPAVIEKYVLEPRIKRVDSVAKSTLALQAMVADRQPDMAPQLATFTERLNITWQKAIGTS